MLPHSLKSNSVVVYCGKIVNKWGPDQGNKFTRTKQGSCASTYCLTFYTPVNLKKTCLEFKASLKKVEGKLRLGEIYLSRNRNEKLSANSDK